LLIARLSGSFATRLAEAKPINWGLGFWGKRVETGPSIQPINIDIHANGGTGRSLGGVRHDGL
jgi:hypothetical protein